MEQKQAQEAAHSINTVYKRTIRSRFFEAVRRYDLVCEHDKIAVCISGGKDSMLLAKLMQEMQAHGGIRFDLAFLTMDPGYSEENRQKIAENAHILGIDLKIFDTDVFRIADKHSKNPCFLCAKMRRGWLYQKAKELGCNKIALGHHYDDVVETILMAMIYGGQVQTMLPKLHSDNFEGMELIRPLYFVREADILDWVRHNALVFLDCACSVSARREAGEGSKRAEIKKLIASLCEGNPQIKQNIMNSVQNIDLNKVIGYRLNGQKHNFMDDYYD